MTLSPPRRRARTLAGTSTQFSRRCGDQSERCAPTAVPTTSCLVARVRPSLAEAIKRLPNPSTTSGMATDWAHARRLNTKPALTLMLGCRGCFTLDREALERCAGLGSLHLPSLRCNQQICKWVRSQLRARLRQGPRRRCGGDWWHECAGRGPAKR